MGVATTMDLDKRRRTLTTDMSALLGWLAHGWRMERKKP